MNNSSSFTTLSLAGAAVLGLLAAKYPDRAIFDEHREGIPYVKGLPLVGTLPLILANRDRVHDFMTSNFERLDSMTTTTSMLFSARRILTIDPRNIEHFLKTNFENYVKGPYMQKAFDDLLGHGIFNANGEEWRFQRKAASLIFNVKNFRDHFTSVFVKDIQYMSTNILDNAVRTGKVIDLHDLMYKFTLDSFVLIGFGVELNGLQQERQVPFAESFDICQYNTSWRLAFPLWRVTEAIKSVLPFQTDIQFHLKRVDDFAYTIISERRRKLANGEEFQDLLSRFMNIRDEVITDKMLRDMIINFIIAGRDTTAQALSWTFYMLALHPRVEAKLLAEIHAHMGGDALDQLAADPSAFYGIIKKDMVYAHAVFYEVLRLYPSVPANIKYALTDDVWPDGTHVRAGDYVGWSPYALGRSTKVWGPDAKEFKPERWIEPDSSDLRRPSQGTWPAFHAGPRVCLGQNLATLESLVALIMLLHRYKFSLAPGQEVTYLPSLTHPMREGVKMFVQARNSATTVN